MDKHFIVLFKALDFFTNPATKKGSLELSRARALVAINIFFVISPVICYLAYSYLWPSGDIGAISTLIFVLVVLINLTIPVLLRLSVNLPLLQQLTLVSTYIASLTYLNVRNETLDILTNNQLLILQAALAVFLLGLRGGLIWSAVIITTQFALHISYSGTELTGLSLLVLIDNVVSFNIVVGLILLIEFSRIQLAKQRDRERERYLYLATHDSLTDLANRTLFEDRLNEAIQNCRKDQSRVVLLYIDLDDFKPVNDRWGHDVGDRVLQIVAARLISTTRMSDTVARLGGDEFAVLMPKLDREVSVGDLSDNIYDRLTQPIHIHGRHLNVGCSIGICCYPENASTAAQFWKQADAAMYIAKKNDIRWYIHGDKPSTAL